MQNLSLENEFDLHENELGGQRHFHINGFARRLILMHRGQLRNGLLVHNIFTGFLIYDSYPKTSLLFNKIKMIRGYIRTSMIQLFSYLSVEVVASENDICQFVN